MGSQGVHPNSVAGFRRKRIAMMWASVMRLRDAECQNEDWFETGDPERFRAGDIESVLAGGLGMDAFEAPDLDDGAAWEFLPSREAHEENARFDRAGSAHHKTRRDLATLVPLGEETWAE